MSVDFSVAQDRATDTVIVTLRGEIDVATAPLAEKAITAAVLESDVMRVVLDMSGVTFLDSTAFSVLVQARELSASNGTGLALRGVSPEVLRLFEIVALDKVFGIEPARD